MPEAFVLFKTQPAHEREVYLSLMDHDSVAEVHALYGEFDLLARLTADDSQTLTKMLGSLGSRGAASSRAGSPSITATAGAFQPGIFFRMSSAWRAAFGLASAKLLGRL